MLGTTWGSDAGGNFTLPDLRGRVIAGQDDMGGSSANRLTGQSGGVNGDTLAAAGGAETHSLAASEIPDNNTISPIAPGSGATAFAIAGHTGTGGAHNNVQPTIIANYIIKT